LLAGAGIGLTVGTAINAQQNKSTPGYFVAELDITDPAKFQSFVQQLPGTLAPFGGHFIVRPGKADALEGNAPKNFGVIAFDSAERAKAWYDSPAYQAIIPLRLNSAKTTAFIVEGVPAQ
jgi:uncharacterized protein (DUF1330 family)